MLLTPFPLAFRVKAAWQRDWSNQLERLQFERAKKIDYLSLSIENILKLSQLKKNYLPKFAIFLSVVFWSVIFPNFNKSIAKWFFSRALSLSLYRSKFFSTILPYCQKVTPTRKHFKKVSNFRVTMNTGSVSASAPPMEDAPLSIISKSQISPNPDPIPMPRTRKNLSHLVTNS